MTVQIDIDLRAELSPVGFQGPRPTCMAFATTAVHEQYRGKKKGLSVEHLFYAGAQRSHKSPRRGLSEIAVTAALGNDGQPTASAWPYQLPEVKTPWTPPPAKHVMYKATLLFQERSLDEVRNF